MKTKRESTAATAAPRGTARPLQVLKYLLLLCLLRSMGLQGLRAQEANAADMHTLTIHDGLAGESVYGIFKSQWGVMWFATTNGLNRYDGKRLTTYRVDDLRSQNKIQDVAQTADGDILCASTHGIYKVEGTRQYLRQVLPDVKGNVNRLRFIGRKLYVAAGDGLYIATPGADGIPPQHVWIRKSHLEGENEVKDLALDADSNLWLLGREELYLYDRRKGKVQGMGLAGQVPITNALRMMVCAGHRIFIGTYNDGLLVFDRKRRTVQPYKDLGCRVITCLSLVQDILYAGTDGAGLHVIDSRNDSTLEVFSTRPESRFRLKDNTIYAFYHDTTGVNFFGYYRQGLQYNHLVRPLFRCYSLRSKKDGRLLFDSRHVNVRSICIDGKVKVLGSRGGLYYIDEEKEVVRFFSPEELGGSIVTSVTKYAGQYYCCTFNGGVMRIDPETLTASRFGQTPLLRTGSYGKLKVSPDDELWMAGNAGLIIYNAHDGTERRLDSHNSPLPETYCNDIVFDRQDRCWISTGSGMCLFSPTDRRLHTRGFPEDFFHNQRETHGILGDRDNLLFYSLDGLFRTDEETTRYGKVTTRVSRANDYVSQAIYDRHRHHYWIATEQGMFRFSDDFDAFTKYAGEAGLASREFSNGAIHIDPDGTLWTGTMEGLYSASLDEAEHYSIGNAPIVLQDVYIGDKAADDAQTLRLAASRQVAIPFHWKIPAFRFAPVLLNYSNQQGLCFEYRLKSGDGTWHTLMNGEQACMEDMLHVGHNTLQVRLAGEKNITEYDIGVYPSLLFLLELAGAVAMGIVLVLAARQRMALKRQREETVRVQQELEETKRKYKRLNAPDDELQRLYQKLQRYMKTEKPYLNAELKLSDLAAQMECSTVKLSLMLNTYAQQGYYDYVNGYRVQEFKERLAKPSAQNYTLLALAEECGFKRSSFFTAFKKMEGITPMAYAKQQGGSY